MPSKIHKKYDNLLIQTAKTNRENNKTNKILNQTNQKKKKKTHKHTNVNEWIWVWNAELRGRTQPVGRVASGSWLSLKICWGPTVFTCVCVYIEFVLVLVQAHNLYIYVLVYLLFIYEFNKMLCRAFLPLLPDCHQQFYKYGWPSKKQHAYA